MSHPLFEITHTPSRDSHESPPFGQLLAVGTGLSPFRRWAATSNLPRLPIEYENQEDQPRDQRKELFHALQRLWEWERRGNMLDFLNASFTDLVWLEFTASTRGWVRDTFAGENHWNGRVLEFDSKPEIYGTADGGRECQLRRTPALVGEKRETLDWEAGLVPRAAWRRGK